MVLLLSDAKSRARFLVIAVVVPDKVPEQEDDYDHAQHESEYDDGSIAVVGATERRRRPPTPP